MVHLAQMNISCSYTGFHFVQSYGRAFLHHWYKEYKEYKVHVTVKLQY